MNKDYKYRLFGRSKGRGKNNLVSSDAKKIEFKKINSCDYNIIDVGVGYGESTLDFARNNFKKNIIAVEKYIDGINKIANFAKLYKFNNIAVFHGNVHQLIDEHLITNSISEIWILFPDPWPKKRHSKRRLININFFNKIKKYLKVKATINIVSDSKKYISEILSTIYEVKHNYLWLNQSKEQWDYSNLSLPKTKYYKKALENGLNPFYVKLIKL